VGIQITLFQSEDTDTERKVSQQRSSAHQKGAKHINVCNNRDILLINNYNPSSRDTVEAEV